MIWGARTTIHTTERKRTSQKAALAEAAHLIEEHGIFLSIVTEEMQGQPPEEQIKALELELATCRKELQRQDQRADQLTKALARAKKAK